MIEGWPKTRVSVHAQRPRRDENSIYFQTRARFALLTHHQNRTSRINETHPQTSKDSSPNHRSYRAHSSLESSTTQHDDRTQSDRSSSSESFTDNRTGKSTDTTSDFVDRCHGTEESVVDSIGEEGIVEGSSVVDTTKDTCDQQDNRSNKVSTI